MYPCTKRLFDVCVSAVGLVALSPLLALIAAAIWLQDRGPVFYKGPRVGLNGQLFRMLKFRTMKVDSTGSGPSSTAADDKRITYVGRRLRALKLDELPQLVNVLRGEMSIVGPRPQVAWAVDDWDETVRRCYIGVRPGITDLASIRFRNEGQILLGSLDPDRDYKRLIEPEKSRLVCHYAEHRCLSLDLRILALTVRSLFVGDADTERRLDELLTSTGYGSGGNGPI